MLQNSFRILPGVGASRESALHAAGIATWDAFLDAQAIRGFSKKRKLFYDRILAEAKHRLVEDDAMWFSEHLPTREHWRLYAEFKDDALFIDIEIASKKDRVTVIGLSDGLDVKTMVSGMHIDKRTFENQLKAAKLLVSFNGKSFDIPVLEKFFGIRIITPHFDVRHACARLGFNGGLKDVERQLSIFRPQELRGNPVDLWKAFWASGDREWLERLADYNAYDCLNLKLVCERIMPLLRKSYEKTGQRAL